MCIAVFRNLFSLLELICDFVILQSDVATLAKCLIIVRQVLISIFECRCMPSQLKKSPPRGIHPTLLQLLETLVIPSIPNDSPAVRREAIPCLGIGCMFTQALATRHFALLMQVCLSYSLLYYLKLQDISKNCVFCG